MTALMSPDGDGVFSYQPDYEEPLNVTVVGGGISGLASAIALRQAGHRLVDASKFSDENGPVIRLGPNSSGLLRRLGFSKDTGNPTRIAQVSEFTVEGAQKNEKDASNLKDLYQHPWEYYDRAELHASLINLATKSTLQNPAVNIRLNSSVAHVEPDSATVTLQGGEVIKGDVILAADGLHSPIRSSIFQIAVHDIQPGKVAVNFTVPVDGFVNNPIVERFKKKPERFETWMHEGKQVGIYQVRNGSLILDCIYINARAGSDSADGTALRIEVLETFKAFSPDLLNLMEKIDPSKIKCWPQNDIPALETWCRQKLVLVGDAAHPFLPYEAQGSAHALEDAAAIAAVLPFGTRPNEIEARLKVFQESRQGRVNHILNFTREIGKDNSASKIERFQKFGSYTYGHDAHDYATGKLRQYLIKEADTPRRMTPVFGILPGPHQSLTGKRFNCAKSTFSTASVTFETSKTYLENFLPTSAYSIVSPGTIALATFYSSSIGNLEWLGGRGYNVFGLCIHNVQIAGAEVEATSKPATGRYLPVVFENLTDSILSGLEEFGFSKMFASLHITRKANQYKLVASWEGTVFAELKLDGLQPETPDFVSEPLRKSVSSTPDLGVLKYKCIPSTGQCSAADAYCPIMTPNPTIENGAFEPVQQRKFVTKPASASIRIFKESKKNLPTLWNVVEGLRGIEILKVVRVELVEGLGGNEVAHQLRL